jgi:O-antigen ligase
MTRPAGSLSPLLAATGVLGGAGLALITLTSPGATRMFAWPWSLAYAVALGAPALGLILRTLDRSRPLTLPSAGGRWVALAVTFTVFASAIASPYRSASLLFGALPLSAVAAFLVIFDWLHADPARTEQRRHQLWRSAAWFGVAIELTSLVLWLAWIVVPNGGRIFDARNPYPLGHSNYTAGLALLMLPGFCASALRPRGPARIGAAVGTALAVVMLLSSGSRGGVLSLGAVLAGALLATRMPRGRKCLVALGCVGAAIVLALANPRTRALFSPPDAGAPPNLSNVQRSAMAVAGWRLGLDRPLLGWGPGTTPLAYPRYRAGLDGGAENVLQLHSLPIQIWAELGFAGLAAALAFIAVALRHSRHDRVAAITLAGYAVFSLSDWQLDVPVFAFALATLAALLAGPDPEPPSASRSRLTGALAIIFVAGVLSLGRPDPTPEWNVRALALARDPAQADRAIALLRESLARNPDQEIAHFNLGWLLVVRDSVAAEAHFRAAAHLVPDKGGVYFGLGLAALNQGKPDEAARAFALECLNDPAFLTSPWWSQGEIGRLRPATLARLAEFEDRIAAQLPPAGWSAREARYLGVLTAWIAGTADLHQVAAAANTAERRAYFSGIVDAHAFDVGAGRSFRRQRTGYPVLMRNLDLETPVDLFDVQVSTRLHGQLTAVFPAKGWLPSPLLLALLDERVSPKN